MCGYNYGYKFKTKQQLQMAIVGYYINLHPLFNPKKITIENRLKYGVIALWDVSLITDMSYLFHFRGRGGTKHNVGFWREKMYITYNFNNKDINNWDVSNVTDMSYMFNRCFKFKH